MFLSSEGRLSGGQGVFSEVRLIGYNFITAHNFGFSIQGVSCGKAMLKPMISIAD